MNIVALAVILAVLAGALRKIGARLSLAQLAGRFE